MTQSTWLIGGVAVGFIVWLAMNNKLSVYWSLLTGQAQGP